MAEIDDAATVMLNRDDILNGGGKGRRHSHDVVRGLAGDSPQMLQLLYHDEDTKGKLRAAELVYKRHLGLIKDRFDRDRQALTTVDHGTTDGAELLFTKRRYASECLDAWRSYTGTVEDILTSSVRFLEEEAFV